MSTLTSVTGGIFNPAVSTALFIIGAIGPVRWALCCIAQVRNFPRIGVTFAH